MPTPCFFVLGHPWSSRFMRACPRQRRMKRIRKAAASLKRKRQREKKRKAERVYVQKLQSLKTDMTKLQRQMRSSLAGFQGTPPDAAEFQFEMLLVQWAACGPWAPNSALGDQTHFGRNSSSQKMLGVLASACKKAMNETLWARKKSQTAKEKQNEEEIKESGRGGDGWGGTARTALAKQTMVFLA